MSIIAKTFYGVTFLPGDVHDVPGYINDSKFIRVTDSEPVTVAKPPVKKQEKPPVKKQETPVKESEDIKNDEEVVRVG